MNNPATNPVSHTMEPTRGPHEAEFVVFYSPGTLYAEITSKPIPSRDVKLAVQMAETIIERYDAKPYGFRFETRIVSEPIPDGKGGTLDVQSKRVSQTGAYFLGGKLETYDEVVARNDPKEDILRSNMKFGSPIVCVTTNVYRSTHPFEEYDFVVDAAGEIAERGDDPRWVAYRNERTRVLQAWLDEGAPL